MDIENETTETTETQETTEKKTEETKTEETTPESKATTEETTTETKEEKTEEKPEEKSEESSDPVTFEGLEVPEGLDTESEAAKGFLETINDSSLSRTELANKMMSMYAEDMKEVANEFEANSAKKWLELNDEWRDTSEKTYGDQLEPKLGKVKQLIEAFDTETREAHEASGAKGDPPTVGDDVKAAFNLTGAGNHPAVLPFLFWLTDQLGEGSPLFGDPASGSQTRAQKMFGT